MYATSRRDRTAMVGGRGRQSRPPVLSPRGTGDRHHLIHRNVHNHVSRRRVALDARSQSPRTSKSLRTYCEHLCLEQLGEQPETDTTTSETTVELNHEQCHLELRTSSSSLCGNSTRIRGVAIQQVKVLISQMNPIPVLLRAT